jgi:glycine/D-amino acid oxidase-like deaminating enzyme
MTRVLIVGGGLLGSAVAYHVARGGADVILVEAGRPGGGTSGATFAWLNAQDKAPAEYFAMNLEGIAEHTTLAASLGDDWLHPGGDLILGRGPGLEAVRERIARHEAQGYPVRTLDRAGLADLEPGLDPGDGELVVGHFFGEAWIDPPILIGRLLARARAAGAVIRVGSPVSRVVVEGGRAVAVELVGGERLAADVIVVAGGPESGSIAATAGVSLPMAPSPGLLVVTEPIAAPIGHIIHAGDVAFRPDGGGRLMLSSRAIDGGLDPATRTLPLDAEPVAEVLARAIRVVPALEGARVERVRVGIRSVPADGQPVIGPAPDVEGLYLLATHSGATLAALLGRLVGAEILGRAEARLDPYRPSRFVAAA